MPDRPNLLIVEDDQNLARMLVEYFSAHGYSVRTVEWGLDAVYTCWENPPTLAILDIHLPDINGYDIARRLRGHRRTRDIPLIFLTSRRRREDRLQGLELGAVDYIAKPFDLQELQLRVRNALRRHQQTAELLYNPITRLPEGTLVDEALTELPSEAAWAVITIQLCNLNRFREAYGFVAADDVLKAVSLRLGEALTAVDADIRFLGQLNTDSFVLITDPVSLPEVSQALEAPLNQPLDYFYPLEERPELLDPARHLMLQTNILTSATGPSEAGAGLKDALLAACR